MLSIFTLPKFSIFISYTTSVHPSIPKSTLTTRFATPKLPISVNVKSVVPLSSGSSSSSLPSGSEPSTESSVNSSPPGVTPVAVALFIIIVPSGQPQVSIFNKIAPLSPTSISSVPTNNKSLIFPS